MQREAALELSDLLDSAVPTRSDREAGIEDAALVAQVRERGSQAHFRLLILRHQQAVFDLVASVLGPRHEQHADEVTQDVFVRVFRKLETFRGEARFSTWLYRVAYNTALDWLRGAARRSVETPWEDTDPGHEPDPEQAARTDQARAAVNQAIERLPDLYRTLIHLHYWRGFSVAEMADTLSAAPGTVKCYLHRARARLQRLLRENPR